MNRKPKLAPRNPLVATSMFRKAGTHDKPYKTQRRADKVVLGRVAHGQSSGLLILRREFEPLRAHQPRPQTHGVAPPARPASRLKFRFPSSSSLVEHPTVNRERTGSSPVWGAKYNLT